MVQGLKFVLASALLWLPLHAIGAESIVLGMGCFWGAEKRMSEIPGVLAVESGYAGGDAPKVGYRDVLRLEKSIRQGRSRERNHAEVIKVTFDPSRASLKRVLIGFWENHDPTQRDRQGNDVGSNYRSVVYWTDEGQRDLALATRDAYQKALSAAGYGPITTEIAPLRNYNRAEEYHQDYLAKNPNGYCGLGGTNVAYPGGFAKPMPAPLAAEALNWDRQLIVFEAEACPFCKQFKSEVLDAWSSDVPVVTTFSRALPKGWVLRKPLFATPTMVLFEQGREIARYTGYRGESDRFWKWLGGEVRARPS